ncbi:HD-GYP domain-containing protein [Thiolapillus sp.]
MTVMAAITPHEQNDVVPGQGLSEQLKTIYQRISRQYPFLSCIGVAATDKGNSSLQLYASSCGSISSGKIPPTFKLEGSNQTPLVVEDMSIFAGADDSSHPPALFQSGLTLPLIANDHTLGYTFFTATEKDCFTPEIIQQMSIYSRVIARLLASEKRTTENLRTAVAGILQLNNVNEAESPAHLRRVAEYSKLIATECAAAHDLDARWIDHLVMFAPLHDIGKVFIPESILLSPDRLTNEEFEQVKTHTLKGRDIIDHMITSFGYQDELHYTNMLRNIILHHHEAMDGSGYPYGLKGEEIPLEARIVAVADVLDALLTRRSYKEAWSMQRTMETMQELAGPRLDPEFVEILTRDPDELVQIRIRCAQE